MQKRKPNSAVNQAKNALRPFFRAKKALPRWQQFQSIRLTLPPHDFIQLLHQVEANPAYRFPGFGSSFPTSGKEIPDGTLGRLSPLSLRRELTLHIIRLNHHWEELLNALDILANVNDALAQHEWELADEFLGDYRSRYGLSLLITRKELLAAFQRGGLSAFSRRYKTIVGDADRHPWGMMCHLVYDMADPAYHPASATKVWLQVINKWRGNVDWYTRIAKSELLTALPAPDALPSLILRYNAVSLFDLLLTVWRIRCLANHDDTVLECWQHLHPDLRAKLEADFSQANIKVPKRSRFEGERPTDAEVYQTSFFFDEIANIARWRCQVNEVLFPSETHPADPLSSPFKRAAQALHDKLAAERCTEAILIPWMSSVLAPEDIPSEYGFLLSVIIAEYLATIKAAKDVESLYVVSLLSKAADLHERAAPATLMALLNHNSAKTSPLLAFMIRDLIFRQRRTADNELERRAAFMDMVPSGSRHDIIVVLDQTFALNRAAALHVAQICTRGFLERLYLLMTSVKDVIETRIAVCAWLLQNDTSPVEAVVEERLALERELANLDARSDLDSTRVHVDEESLREWFLDTQQPAVSRYVRTALGEGHDFQYENFIAFYGRLTDKIESENPDGDFLLDTQIGSQFILLHIVEVTLSVFVGDKTFGLDSYLSRRIRHGTLSGFLLTPLARVVRRVYDDISDEELTSDHDNLVIVHDMLDEWRKSVSSALDDARRSYIQVRSDRHPDGLIEATWRTPANVTHVDAMMSHVRRRVLETRGDYDVFPDVHALCWDLIESDLAQLRLYMLQMLYRPLHDQLREQYDALSYDTKAVAYRYFAEIATVFESRILEVSGWFVRPVFRRDTYDLSTLIGSTMSIVRELDANYEFQEDVVVDDSITINRGSFEVLGDILFVLIGNAAKHGHAGGTVRVGARRDEQHPNFVTLEVASEMESQERFDAALARIREAFNVPETAALDTAAVSEGFSGIRKIIGLIRRVRSPHARIGVYPDAGTRRIIFEACVPSKITFKRERT